MNRMFPELVIGGVLISPFVSYAGLALLLFLVARPILARLGFEQLFSSPPAALLSLYIVMLAALIMATSAR